MEILGYIGALVIGLVLGLVGGGGSILTVPLLVYVFSIEPILATAYSLFIVGVSSTFGTIKSSFRKLVDFRIGFLFSVPSFIGVFLSRKFLIPMLPDRLFSIGTYSILKESGIMIFFGLLMLTAAFLMLKQKKEVAPYTLTVGLKYLIILIEGFLIGIVTGLVGAGGGFLIIPALILLTKLPVKKAIDTSLLIISLKSLIGFLGDLENLEINWLLLLSITGVSVVGIFIGNTLNHYVDGSHLKKWFGRMVFVMGLSVVLYEISQL